MLKLHIEGVVKTSNTCIFYIPIKRIIVYLQKRKKNLSPVHQSSPVIVYNPQESHSVVVILIKHQR